MKQSLKMLEQIIERARYDDLQFKKLMIETHQGSKSVGDSWMVFHLTELKKLMEKEHEEKE